jgi:hypothetical protein
MIEVLFLNLQFKSLAALSSRVVCIAHENPLVYIGTQNQGTNA